jgi:hypothetical protein
MQHFPKPPTQFLHIKFNGLLILTKNQKNQILHLLQSYSGTTSTAANTAIYVTGYQTPKFNINYLYSWAQVMNLTEVIKNM